MSTGPKSHSNLARGRGAHLASYTTNRMAPGEEASAHSYSEDESMDFLTQCFGEGSDLTVLQICARTMVVFIFTLVMIRVAGRRSFGQRSAFDSCVVVLLGAVLSRAIVGASPFVATLSASFVLVLLHRVLAIASIQWAGFERLVNGSERILVDQAERDDEQMRLGLISRKDLAEAVRKALNTEDMRKVKKAVLERNGEITVIEH